MTGEIKYRFVPCSGCTLCCRGDAIRLTAEDNSKQYITEPHPYIAGALMIAHKENGDCIYLDPNGCRIHNSAPSLCRIADCRSIALRFGFPEAMELHRSGKINIKVWDKGKELLEKTKK